ncbi:CRISPR-associated protein Csy1 [Oceanospirillum multiglobuliferum]|uniref:Type I-F CRISPR-associated protein Csy1 n=1 Tax=Oceanospirillum multiglobuliferum TaxID=64969 RepID=A0A1T4P1Z1_9GAMM|nr:type I-F CRISPR-associated protein Csy1 [Oceanospirillum multiglobuliferum]OPX55107.1 type I-F CRISPR-associated protein Csy1 [Oceanospirillum multiglobuliferum]SJZ85544.1 CRISPR-associated protein Csy1 [Oceanospirillum multiglobuliferum]
MSDPAIEAFFAERKAGWLKKNLKATMTEEEVRNAELECEEVFALKNWLPNAAKRAGQISLSTHPCTFSHPSARKNKNGYVSSVLAQADYKADGFFRSGNLKVEPDALGNAAALDVHKFLTLVMHDGSTLLEHLQKNSDLAVNLLAAAGNVEDLKEGLLAMVSASHEVVTSSKIKQVYFPVSDGSASYHLLSILSHSGHLFEMRKRLDHLRFSEETKSARELRKHNHFSERSYQEIYNLTTIGYGGTKPQNISVLNNQNAGKAHLLLSMPPELSPRSVRLPSHNFFGDTLYPKQLQETFQAFHRLMSADYNNLNIRKGRDYRIQEYLDHLILKMWQVRKAFAEQTHSRPETLPSYQKTWLLPEYEQERLESQGWLNELTQEATRYFYACYKRVIGNSAIVLGDTEYMAFARIIEQNKEALL